MKERGLALKRANLELVAHQEQWQLLGNGAFNQTPITFRHDPDFVYFLGIDDNLIDVRGNKRSDLLNTPFNLSDLTGEDGIPVVHDRPLPLNHQESPLQAEARRFLAELFHLTTGADSEGKPLMDTWGVSSLTPWLSRIQKNLNENNQSLYLNISSIENKTEASLGESQGLNLPSLPRNAFTAINPSDFVGINLAGLCSSQRLSLQLL